MKWQFHKRFINVHFNHTTICIHTYRWKFGKNSIYNKGFDFAFLSVAKWI